MTKKIKPKILLDADVVIHFVKGGQISLLPTIFEEEKVILDKVLEELQQHKELKQYYENLVSFGLIKEISFSKDIKVLQEYSKLRKKFGKGESACMAYCKFNNNVLASSNLKDIKDYCIENNIEYITTMDFLKEAYEKNLLTETECDFFIYNVKSKGSKLPCDSISEYIESF
ncbi:MAG: hypothetical protein A2033_12900 [Bacteroidetes bacterium GWA2_31_9]|nr:MAG: hypothetical protein A2033_12900 [Bacteroidetes bacterium GWA2_31_9]